MRLGLDYLNFANKLTDDIVVIEQLSTANTILAGSTAFRASLVNANKVVDVASLTTGAL